MSENIVLEVLSGTRLPAAEHARRNGWGVGTRLAGDEGYGETIIRITAIGERSVLAVRESHRGEPCAGHEQLWTFDYRDWKETP